VLEAVVLTPPFLALVTVLKWSVMQVTPRWASLAVVAYPDVAARLSDPAVVKLLVIYAVSSAVQELIVRGALQSSLQLFLVGARSVQRAILVSAVLFAAMHLHMGFLFAAFAFVPGLFWGWLYARRPNLVGVTLSHVAVGAYVFFVLGVGLPPAGQ
jgi:membrane protease YdiL (CAAX protease family)